MAKPFLHRMVDHVLNRGPDEEPADPALRRWMEEHPNQSDAFRRTIRRNRELVRQREPAPPATKEPSHSPIPAKPGRIIDTD